MGPEARQVRALLQAGQKAAATGPPGCSRYQRDRRRPKRMLRIGELRQRIDDGQVGRIQPTSDLNGSCRSSPESSSPCRTRACSNTSCTRRSTTSGRAPRPRSTMRTASGSLRSTTPQATRSRSSSTTGNGPMANPSRPETSPSGSIWSGRTATNGVHTLQAGSPITSWASRPTALISSH